VTVGERTHYCRGLGKRGGKAFARIVNLYVQRNRKWVKVGTMCSSCGDHWIEGTRCTATNAKKPAS